MSNMLTIITARGGSKAIPNKNIAMLAGKPMIAWTIEAALNSSYVERVIVSTDSPQIAEISKKYGAEVPFIRPAELSKDDSPHIPVILHALEWIELNEGKRYDCILLLQPTSPLRTSEDISNAIRIFNDRDADAVVSVCRPKHHPSWMKTITGDGKLLDYLGEGKKPHQRQLLSDVYALNGAIYIAKCDILKNEGSFFGDRTYPYIMSPENSVDIDDHMDMKFAEMLLNGRMNI